MTELHIVGAGIAGLLVAKECVDLFDKIFLYEEDKQVGLPEHCTGLVSEKFLHLVPEAAQFVQGHHRCIVVVNEKLRPVAELRLRERTVVVSRPELEQRLAEKLTGRDNIVLKKCARVESIQLRENSVHLRLSTSAVTLSSDSVVIVCEGSRQYLARTVLGYYSRRYVYGLQCDVVAKVRPPEDTIVVILSRKYAEDYFAWIVPLEDSRLRVGVGYRSGPGLAYLSRLLKLVKTTRVLRTFGGKILLDKPAQRFGIGRVVFVGDSVSQVKPLTGGGNLIIALTAKLLREVVREVMKLGCLDKLAQIYTETWYRVLGKFTQGWSTLRDLLYGRVLSEVLQKWVLPLDLTFLIDDFDIQARYITKPALSSYGHYLADLLK